MLAVDAIPEMLEKARGRCSRFANVEFLCEDLADLEMEPADLVVSYYTMQFVPPRCRGDVLGRVYSSLNWGGALALFEKVRAPDACFQDIGTALYSEFKLERGFSKAEILQKQRSLKGVLEPFSTAQNLALLERAGFRDVMTLLKYVCFEGYLAIKSPT
jgi:tRNA (cmo5U34)-methyltransferase